MSALVLGPTVLALAWFGGWAFAALAAVSGAVLVGEWSGVSRGRYFDAAVALAAACVCGTVLAFAAGMLELSGILLLIGILGGQLLAWRSDPGRLFAAGILYAALPMLGFVVLRQDPDFGLFAVAWLMIIVWATDIGAYFSGRMIGGPRLAPRVSPNKTWAGAAGGLVSAVGASLVFVGLTLQADMVSIAILAALLSVVSEAGDLFESGLKRRFGAKDASRLIPGHGGLMDRIDSLVAAALLAAIVGVWRGGLHSAGAGLMLW
ncbi:phosphatidate cytidylyltransferase [Microbaculum marinum]|uniref:Phosphatidate cytidylyltransferase n=1 Tax=Microbaculum marinum TaxID=1764581 RepID=A0AAW9RLN5_9HYPH